MGNPAINALLAGFQPGVFLSKVVTPTMIAGRMQSLWYLNGIGMTAGAPNATLNGANYVSSSVIPSGVIEHYDPGAGINAYVAKFLAAQNIAGVALLCDRLWDNQLSAGSTSQQNITQPTLPARDQNGTTNGQGVQLALEIGVATSATANVAATLSYTNSAGTAAQSASMLETTTAAVASIGQFFRIQLAKGDQGVRSVQSITFSTAWATGTIHLVAYRVLAVALPLIAHTGQAIDPMTGSLPQLYNGACPFVVLHPETTTASIFSGFYSEVWV